MLAVATKDTLSIVDAPTLKRAPSSVPSCICLVDPPSASVWSVDNAYLYLASSRTIHAYDASLNSLRDLFCSSEEDEIVNIVSKDKATLIFSQGNSIHVLECGPSPKITQTFESHKSPVTSLSLSNDSSLLASTSTDSVHVHNLSLGSHTVLRGLGSCAQPIFTGAFHPHSRTRLLVTSGHQILIFDTTRPSAPLKSITMADTALGGIISLACSPFSKTLVAAATSGGSVGLVDLEKEKGLFRTLNFKVPLTSIQYSQEGASIYLGTESGKLLIADLRALDKPPKSIILNENGNRIESISIQKKSKESASKSTPGTTNIATKKAPLDATTERRPSAVTRVSSVKSSSKVVSSPSRRKIVEASETSPARRTPSTLRTGQADVSAPKKVFSPVRDPLGNSKSGSGDISVTLETLGSLKNIKGSPPKSPGKESVSRSSPRTSPKAKEISESISAASARTSRSSTNLEVPKRARTVPTQSSRLKSAATRDVISTTTTESISHGSARPRTLSSASRMGSEVASQISGRSSSRKPSTASRPPSSASQRANRDLSPIPPVPPLPESESGTPPPELPNDSLDPMTPIMQKSKKSTLKVLGLGTPEVDAWINAGKGSDRKGKGRTVGFKDEDQDSGSDDDDEKENKRERSLSMQISPRRPTPGVAHSSSSQSWAPSPLRRSPDGNAGGSAHDLLKSIVKDVMFDFQQETRGEMVGLHLDLLRMGRGWKKELRELMNEYVGDLRDLREENARLRAENELLRRGY